MFSSLRIPPTTPLGKQQNKKLKTILQNLFDKPESYDFQMPVDWRALGLTDYTFIIKNPMDLGTINEKLKEQKYRFVQQFLDDLQLVWDNCKTYNQPGTWIYGAAQSLERSFKKMVKNYLPSIPIVIPGRSNQTSKTDQKKPSHSNMFQQQEGQQPTYHEKMKLFQKIKHLQEKQLGDVVQFIKNKSPQCFKSEGENGQLLLDKMSKQFFDQVYVMVHNSNIQAYDKTQKKVKI